jgi:hypothetical protein
MYAKRLRAGVSDSVLRPAGLLMTMALVLNLPSEEAKAQYHFSIVAKTGDMIGGRLLSDIWCDNPSINNAGTVVYLGSWGWQNPTILTQNGVVVTQGDTIGGKKLDLLANPSLSDTGVVAFHGTYSGGSGVFTQNSLVTKTGDTISGLTLTGFGSWCSVNAAGSIEFDADYSGGSGAFTQNGVIAKTGDIIGGHTLTRFTDLGDRRMNNAGDVVFQADYQTDLPGHPEVWGIFSRDRVIAVPGDTIAGIQIIGFHNGPFLNDAGTVAFCAITASGGAAIFTQDSIIAKPGDIIGGLTLTNVGCDPALNDMGTVVFGGAFSGGLGLFTQHGVVAKTGDVIDGKTISAFTYMGTGTAHASVNDFGDIAFYAEFSDGSKGIILAQLVPEPTTSTLFGTCAASLFLYVLRRRNRTTLPAEQ